MGTGYKVAVASIVVLVLAVVGYYFFAAKGGSAKPDIKISSQLPAPTPPQVAAATTSDPSLTPATVPGSSATGASTATGGSAPSAQITDDDVQALLNRTASPAATGTSSTTPGTASTSAVRTPGSTGPSSMTGSSTTSGMTTTPHSTSTSSSSTSPSSSLVLSATDGSAPPIRPLPDSTSSSSSTSSSFTSTTSRTATLGSSASLSTTSSSTYTVKQGDTMWIIAEKQLGNGARWSLIAKANPRIDPSNLQVGQKLVIPSAPSASASSNTLTRSSTSASANTATTTAVTGKTVTVAEGDSLWSIAEQHLGDGNKWKLIFNANRNILHTPDDLQVGQKLVVPTR